MKASELRVGDSIRITGIAGDGVPGLHRYCTEFEFRWNHRKVTDGERMVAAIRGVVGKRLFYVQPVEAA